MLRCRHEHRQRRARFVGFGQLERRHGEQIVGPVSPLFAVFDARESPYLGGCGINGLDGLHRFANLGYWIRTAAVGRGVATAAARLTADFGFEQLALERLELVIEPANTASIRVAEKLGAQREGLLRRRLNFEGEQRDALMFSLIRGDLQ